MSELKDRLQELRQAFGISQRQLAKRIGVTSQLVSMMETGKSQISHLTAKAIESEFGVNHEWLITGEGEMMIKRLHTYLLFLLNLQQFFVIIQTLRRL